MDRLRAEQGVALYLTAVTMRFIAADELECYPAKSKKVFIIIYCLAAERSM